ncbi:MAG: acyl-CoA thioester hydrolase [Halioglobus sp.]
MPAIDSLPWDYPSPFTQQVRVTAKDIDGLNHTNNTVYVKWCEKVAWAHSCSLGLDLNCYRRLNRAMAINHAQYHYLKASHEGQELGLATWITEWDKKLTMKRHFQIVRLEDEVTLLRAEVRFVCIDIASGRPRRLPAEFIEGYGPAILHEA